jgi:hypothetical protein
MRLVLLCPFVSAPMYVVTIDTLLVLAERVHAMSRPRDELKDSGLRRVESLLDLLVSPCAPRRSKCSNVLLYIFSSIIEI